MAPFSEWGPLIMVSPMETNTNARIFTLHKFARMLNATIQNFPITFREAIQGRHPVNELHEHEFVELVVVTAGTAVHNLDGRRHLVREGDILLIYPHSRHCYDECGTMGLINIMYDPAKLPMPVLDGERIPLFRRFFPQDINFMDFRSGPEPLLHIASREDLEQVIREAYLLRDELISRQPGNMFGSVICLLALIQRILRLGVPMVEDTKERRVLPLTDILEYVNENYTRDITVTDLAQRSHYSRGTFHAKFKKLTGYSVTNYLLRKRIALAQKLLREEPDCPIGEVAFKSGFLCANYFSRVFHKITGMAPREFRVAKSAPTQFVE